MYVFPFVFCDSACADLLFGVFFSGFGSERVLALFESGRYRGVCVMYSALFFFSFDSLRAPCVWSLLFGSSFESFCLFVGSLVRRFACPFCLYAIRFITP